MHGNRFSIDECEQWLVSKWLHTVACVFDVDQDGEARPLTYSHVSTSQAALVLPILSSECECKHWLVSLNEIRILTQNKTTIEILSGT